MDRNQYYGADSASLNLSNLFAKFNGGKQPEDRFFEILGQNRDYNIDLIPKCIMACGKLVKMLLHTKVTRYLEFKSLDASYVYRGGKVYKVHATKSEAMRGSGVPGGRRGGASSLGARGGEAASRGACW